MASNDLGDELLCSICLNIYTDPVTLRCGHNFCRDCIDQFLNTQDEYGVYSCPECRGEFQDRPELIRNIALHNVAERLLLTQPDEEITRIFCTYCMDSPVPAVKSCLLCEASLCDNHLKVHSKEAEHILTDPSTSLKNRKCSVHKEVLKYYCTKEAICICVSCSLAGEHQGHRVEILDEASEKKKKKLRNVLQILTSKREKSKYQVHGLEEQWRKAQQKAAGEAARVTAVFIDIRRRLDDLEKRKLEIKKEELSRKMRHIEELCNMTDPLTILQDPDTGDLYDAEKGEGDEDTGGHDIDVDAIIGMIHAGFSDIMTYLPTISATKQKYTRTQPPSVRSLPSHTQALHFPTIKYVKLRSKSSGGEVMATGKGGVHGQAPSEISLHENTADNIIIADDQKTWTRIKQNCTETAERFQDHPQVIGRRTFSSGRHYWDVEISGSRWWRVGMCYPIIDKGNGEPIIGDYKTWSLCKRWKLFVTQYSVIHDSKEIQLSHRISSDRVRIYVDYEAGQLSFYDLCDPSRHLHTFTTTFTEPLHAALWEWEGSIKVSGGGAVPVRNRDHRGSLPKDW
ncbi:E3 ubiquitin/ISG15 ligase TRIM25-like [Dendropsophus ebraccatus]|uniref:E3 ubiquitin/ISG15 ligase TRIM25-like n=1 Tax=Dendropsophus ebraccatus TaxID=150705 RepID=UPI00383210F0